MVGIFYVEGVDLDQHRIERAGEQSPAMVAIRPSSYVDTSMGTKQPVTVNLATGRRRGWPTRRIGRRRG